MLAFPPLNPIRFYSFEELKFLMDGNCEYQQKWQDGDSINLQILKSDVNPIGVKVINSRTGQIVLAKDSEVLPNNILVQDLFVHSLNIELNDIGEFGVFHILIENTLRSFDFDFSPIQEGTIKVEYSNTTNDFNVIFEVGFKPQIRLEGSLSSFIPRLDSTVYEDQNKNIQMLKGVPFRTYTLFIGNGRGIPDWLLDIFNSVLACDSKKIEGLGFEITEGSELEVQRIPSYPLVAASIEVSEKHNPSLRAWSRFNPPLLIWSQDGDDAVTEDGSNIVKL